VRKRWVALVASVVLVGGVGAAVVLQREDLPVAAPEPSPTPYPVRTPLLVAATGGPAPTAAGLSRALGGALRERALGSRVSLSVVDVSTGRALLESDATRQVTPASTAKLATAVAALTVLEPDSVLTTTVVAGRPGEVVLVGGGDPTLSDQGLAHLAAQIAKTGTAVSRVVVDDSLFSGPRLGPAWKTAYVQHGNVAPVSALAVDEGRTSQREGSPRVSDPAVAVGRRLAKLLGARSVLRGRAVDGARRLAALPSAPLSALVERMLTDSDNDLAEALGRRVAIAMKLPATFEGEAAAVDAALHGLGVEVALQDASGLSTLDRVQPSAVTMLLTRAAREPRYAAVLSGLPVAGFDGTLSDRFRSGPSRAAAGQVRAKTGTLDGVSALAGLVRTRDGRLLAFDVTADGVALGATVHAQQALDLVAAVLAACGCR